MTYAKMDTKVKAKWVEALRSGEYPQSRYALCTDKGYCCLGVLADIQGYLTGRQGESKGVKSADNSMTYTGEIPRQQLEQMRLADSAHEKLIRLNDKVGLSFKQIAQWIEENL